MKTIVVLFLMTVCVSVFSQQNQPGYSFTENKGQILDKNSNPHSEILFTGQGENYSIYLRKDGWSYVLKSYDSTSYQAQRIDIDIINYNSDFKFEPKNKLSGFDNFPIRNDETINNVYSFGEVVYKNIYLGIDLRFYFDSGNLRYDFIVHSGSSPNQIQMKINNTVQPYLNDKFGINIPTQLGEITKEKPFTYQITENQKEEIYSNYLLKDNLLGFRTGNYDKNKDLIIDPVSLIYGKLRRMKAYFHYSAGLLDEERSYYSWSLANKNIKRLSDNSVILLSNNALDNQFINENYENITGLFLRKADFLPTVISKYDSVSNKVWSVYLYEKQNNVISWDANDSLIVVYAHSYHYYDNVLKEYNKDAVFVSLYDNKGNLQRRFELTKPEGIVQFIHPQQDDNLAWWNRLGSFRWIDGLSYENTIKLNKEQISLIAVGRYAGNNDSTYNCSLFHQNYNLNGNLLQNKILKHNIMSRRGGIITSDSSFYAEGVVGDIHLIRFLENGDFFNTRSNSTQRDFEFYDNKGNFKFKLNEESEFVFFQKKYDLSGDTSEFKYPFGSQLLAYNIDKDKNFFMILHCDSNDAAIKKYKNLVKINPYSPTYKLRQPYFLKFDSTGKLLWLTQILSFPINYTITNNIYHFMSKYKDTLWSLYDVNGCFEGNYLSELPMLVPNYRTAMNIGSDIVMAFDSVGNIFIPRIIDSCQFKVQSTSRKLVICKISPQGDLLWQDTSALNFHFKDVDNSFKSSVMKIKKVTVVGNSLYLEYFVSNLDDLTTIKESEKFDLKEFYPRADLRFLVYDDIEAHPIQGSDLVSDLLFLKYNINENDLVGFENLQPVNTAIFDTLCIGERFVHKFKVINKWHSKMDFEVPVIEGDGFELSPTGKFSLNSGESKEFSITFIPTELKMYNSKIIFKQNNIVNFSNTVYLSGVTKATILKSDSVWDMGSILINNTVSKNFRIYNKGNINAWVQGTQNFPAEFKQIIPISSNNYLKGGDSLDFQIEFTPTKAGIFDYKYRFISYYGCTDTLDIILRGRGVTESIILNYDSLDYGYLYSCETKTDTITIENVTNNPVTYNSSVITGTNQDNFKILVKPTDGTILLRGNPAKFIIEYKPLPPFGIKKAVLEITTSEKLINCPLKAELDEIDITANNIDFGFRNINVTYDTVITIKNNTKRMFTLENVIPSDSRITVSTILPIDIPSMDEKELSIQIKSTVSDPLNSNIRLIFSDKCTTEVSSNIKCHFDSTKVEINGIDFGYVPYCEEKTDNIIIRNTGKTSVKIINIEFSDNDGKFEFVNNTIFPVELTAENTFTKSVKYLSGIKQKSQNSTKILITLEIDGVEKTFEIDIKGERIIPDISYQNLINIDQSKPGEIKTKDIEIINNSEEIIISDVIINDNTNFQIKDYSKIINKNAKGNVIVSFSSEIIGSYSSDLTVYFKFGECIDSLKIVVNAEVKRLMLISANHDTVDVGIMGYNVPIYAKTDKDAKINGSSYSLNIKYLPEIYNSVTSEDAVITSTTREGNYEISRVEGKFPEFKDSSEVLFHLKGNILFSNVKHTPIEIEFLQSESSLSVTTRDGSLTLNPLCIDDLRGIISYKPASMSVTPHPLNENSKINVISQNTGLHVLEFYSVSGEKYEIARWTQNNNENQIHELTLENKTFPNGVYLLNLRMEWSNVQEIVVVVE